ncbi:MAG: hypothetical protein L6R38_007769 [Xanthoria sp. 2 TBL-2021]|nr:MAG: hypothetical protein L6R38_007769 [Xanthoria sp. 2 TBL-2021]
MAAPTLFILYNADASVMGKLSYGYKKLTNKDKDKPTCAACDITHGGLSLDETSQWKAAKADLLDSGAVKDIKQFHRDELDHEIKEFVQSRGLQFPMVLARNEGSDLRSVMSSEDLATFKGDPQTFMKKIRDHLGGSQSAL